MRQIAHMDPSFFLHRDLLATNHIKTFVPIPYCMRRWGLGFAKSILCISSRLNVKCSKIPTPKTVFCFRNTKKSASFKKLHFQGKTGFAFNGDDCTWYTAKVRWSLFFFLSGNGGKRGSGEIDPTAAGASGMQHHSRRRGNPGSRVPWSEASWGQNSEVQTQRKHGGLQEGHHHQMDQRAEQQGTSAGAGGSASIHSQGTWTCLVQHTLAWLRVTKARPNCSDWLCEVHLWSEHLAVTAGWPFCGSDKNCVMDLMAHWDPPPNWRSPEAIWAIYSLHIWEVGWVSQTCHPGTPPPHWRSPEAIWATYTWQVARMSLCTYLVLTKYTKVKLLF